jgi:hypothetical protein
LSPLPLEVSNRGPNAIREGAKATQPSPQR